MFRSPFAAALAASMVVAVPAVAHTQLTSSTPAANATVRAPTTITLNFNERIMAPTATTTIVMTGMPGMADHAPMPITGYTTRMGADGRSMTLVMRRALAAGTYRVTWTAAGADAHRMNGSFDFTVR